MPTNVLLAAVTETTGSFGSLFEVFMPRRQCMRFEADVIWMHLVSDVLIAASYYSIPLALLYFVRKRRDLAFHWVFLLFAGFIVACGTTHIFNVWALWQPMYRLDGIVKALTAAVSVLTAILLWPLIPKALALPSPEQLSESNALLAQEVADRRRAEQELLSMQRDLERRVREQTAELSAIMEVVPTAICVSDGRGVTGNPACRKLFRLPAGAELSESFLSGGASSALRIYHEGRELAGKEFPPGCVVEAGQPWSDQELEFRFDDGTSVHVLCDAVPLAADGTKIRGYVTTFTDISERKRAEVERVQLLEGERVARGDAERANRMKDEFLSTVSHELRTPLNAILGWTTLLSTGKLPADEGRQALEVIERNTRVQVQIIDDILDMSRIVAGKLRLDVRPLQPGEVIDAAIDTVRPMAEARQVRLHKVLDPRAAPVLGDPDRLQQVVWNLLSNAIKFSPKGSRVEVALSRVNSHIEISVADTGAGIDPDFLPHVFDRFRQFDSSTTRAHGGLGLGLAIVRHLTELHGGTVHASSAGVGQGATFVVKLPLMAAHESNVSGSREHPTAGGSPAFVSIPDLEGLRVLVIDDDADSRELVKRLLEESRALVATGGSYEDALRLLAEFRPDILLSDIGMPNVDGYELIRHVRALAPEDGGQIQAAALTAFARSEDRTRALLAGFQAHIAKPVEQSELVAVVAMLARRGKAD